MATPDRKYLSEFAVNLCSARTLLLPADQLASDGEMDAQAADISENCHIYVICSRPSCSFDPEKFIFDGQKINANLLYKVDGKSHVIPFEMPFRLLDNARNVHVSSYPHREIQTTTDDGAIVRYVPASSLSIAGIVDEEILRELEVLYVGQAYAKGNRSAIDRLKSHSTLQKILADVLYKMPDHEILILAFEYVPYRVIASIDGIDKTAIRDESDALRFISIMDNPLTEHQQICLAEAGLIRYFQPEYNEIYKSSFPADDQKILHDCYKYDFSGLITEIDTEDLHVSLYSTTVSPSYHHIAQFDLIDPKKRRSFFTMVDREGNVAEMPDVIAPSR